MTQTPFCCHYSGQDFELKIKTPLYTISVADVIIIHMLHLLSIWIRTQQDTKSKIKMAQISPHMLYGPVKSVLFVLVKCVFVCVRTRGILQSN